MAGEVPQFVKISLRSVLLSSAKGIKQTGVEKDYLQLTNSKLDYKQYGFQDLYEFLLAIPDVARLEFSIKDGENKVFGVPEKGVFISKHAKKAEGVPNGLKSLHPSEWPRNKRSKSKDRTVVHDKASLKVTVDSDQTKVILPNYRGLYAIHIAQLPSRCQESELRSIFKNYKSLSEVKIDNSHGIAFLRFSKHADAVQAMSDMNGYKLRGSVLKINPATEHGSVQNAKSSKERKEETKIDTKKQLNKNSLIINGFASEDAVVTELRPSSSVKDKSPLSSPKELKTVLSEESWETESALLPKITAEEKKKIYKQENSAISVCKEIGGYPIHVSNFPAGMTQESLRQILSVHGKVVKVVMKKKYAFVYFAEKDEAVAALEELKGTKVGDKILTVTPKLHKGKAKQQKNFLVGTMGQSLTSSESSISSCDPLGPQSSPYNNFSDGALDSGGSKKDQSGVSVNGFRESSGRNVGQNQESGKTTSDNSCSVYNKKLEENEKISSSSRTSVEKGHSSPTSKPEISVVKEEIGPRHILLTNTEMSELYLKCKKPLRTMDNMEAQEFEVLVTDVVDSCHFWANIDDKSGSYKELEQIRTDLQIVEHYKRCMPVKHQLGAAIFSEDNLWYRCWCLEVTKMDKKQAKVFYLDYGNCEWISWDQFTDIHKRFWDLAPQAVPFKLAGIEVATDLSPETMNEGSAYLSALIIDKVCTARVCHSSDANQPHVIEVELLVKDDNGKDV
ncbi:Multiple RNA-binding domain-containing protein 1 [Stylophora pistillata]|uniref:Multiple RNA-binding domain-containing protein 1 n=3 Tax=Stylophora pistillata TaxID=50429 RepID=A0A2B4SQU6_STYPI|nr:Multiple RNA-binding domain-containing protein 1 [Stylophora pistillata]